MAEKGEECPKFDGRLDFADWDKMSKDDQKAIEANYYEICPFLGKNGTKPAKEAAKPAAKTPAKETPKKDTPKKDTPARAGYNHSIEGYGITFSYNQ